MVQVQGHRWASGEHAAAKRPVRPCLHRAGAYRACRRQSVAYGNRVGIDHTRFAGSWQLWRTQLVSPRAAHWSFRPADGRRETAARATSSRLLEPRERGLRAQPVNPWRPGQGLG
eukprot:13401786-Alexandrium_andersonii.AAC.1